MIAITQSEEYKGIVTLHLDNGHKIEFETKKLHDYIESEKLNVADTYGGNSGNGEPWNDLDSVEETEDIEDFLDRKFDEVCEMYYKFVILN